MMTVPLARRPRGRTRSTILISPQTLLFILPTTPFPIFKSTYCQSTCTFLSKPLFYIPRPALIPNITPSKPPPQHLYRCALPISPPPTINPRILTAIETLATRQLRITPSDVASLAGISITDAQNALVSLSAVLHSGVDVSTTGDLSYRLGKNVRFRLRNLSNSYRLQELWEKIKKWGIWGIQRAFGITLGLSIIVTFAAIFVILSASASSGNGDDNGGRRSGGGRGYGYGGDGGFGLRLGVDLMDLFWYQRYRGYYYYDGDGYWGNYGRRRRNTGEDEKKGVGMLEAVYSCVFGDGDPNEGLEEYRWARVADVIRANGGAVVAEQIAGLLDLSKNWKPAGEKYEDEGDGLVSHVDEDFMMEVAQRFNGRPEVTDDGDIVYVFPDMVTTGNSALETSDRRGGIRGRFFGSGNREASPTASPDVSQTVVREPLREKRWKMTRASGLQKFLVGGLGILNGAGVAILGNLLGQVRNLSGIVGLARGIYPLLAIYAATYFAVPALRWIWIRSANRSIDERNEAREHATAATGRRQVMKKIQSAKRYAMEHNVVQDRDVIFRSDRELGVGTDGVDEEDFDRRLKDAARKKRKQ